MVDVCCLRMSARCSRPMRPTAKDVTRLSNAISNHDCGNLARVVMVRKTDQRVINHKSQKDHPIETITMETISTYKGHKPDRTVVIKKRDLSASGALSTSPSCERDQGYSSLNNSTFSPSSRKLNSEMSKDFSSLSLLTPDDATAYNSTNNSPNNNPRKTILNGVVNRDSNNNPYGTPTLYSKHNRNSLNTKIQQQQQHNIHTETLSLRNSPSLRHSPNFRHSTPSPINRRSFYTDFEIDCLKTHNEYRLRHGVPALKLSKRLCKHAEEWARILASRGVLIHRNNSQYGENIFCLWSSNANNNHVSGREVVDSWYAEISQHVFHREPTTLKTGHFTQVVWKESRELGVGMAKNRSGEIFVVANYDPPGNFIGSFEKNVPPLVSDDGSRESEEKSSVEGGKTFDEELEEFAQKMLKYHNEYRKKHFAVELKITKNVMNDAQRWAEKLAEADKFTYRQNSQYGENLYCLWSSDRDAWPNPKEVCKSWYDEVKQYTWNVEPKTSFKAGQFSQMVWKSSRELGIGVGRTKNGKVIVVASYYPRGNIIGHFTNNVRRNN